jgi:hypothetical protein
MHGREEKSHPYRYGWSALRRLHRTLIEFQEILRECHWVKISIGQCTILGCRMRRKICWLVFPAIQLAARNDLPGIALHLCHSQRPNSSTYERIPAVGRLTRRSTASVLQACVLDEIGVHITCCLRVTQRMRYAFDSAVMSVA